MKKIRSNQYSDFYQTKRFNIQQYRNGKQYSSIQEALKDHNLSRYSFNHWFSTQENRPFKMTDYGRVRCSIIITER